jgi:uncharacterized protein (DUF362 family)
MNTFDRRNFLKTSVFAGVAASCFDPIKTFASFNNHDQFSSRVALTTGDNRADLAFRALQPFAAQIKKDIGSRRVVLKPNMVNVDKPLCATHADTIEGVLEFLKSIRKLDNAIIAESAGNGPSSDGYENYGYFRLAKKYSSIKYVDLDHEGLETIHVFDERDFRPHPVRFSRILLNPDSYIISIARMKTHDQVVVTLSLKNIVFGAPVKDIGFTAEKSKSGLTKNDKRIVHGGGFKGINYNIYDLATRLHPDLAVIDGFEGMEGNGPVRGTPVDHRICVASTNWFAADRVAVELMGVDFAKVGYLNYCAQTGSGIADLNKTEIIGERIANHIKTYRLSDNIEKQLIWMKST